MGSFVVSVFSVGIVRLPKLEMLNVIHHSEMVRRDAVLHSAFCAQSRQRFWVD